MCVKIKAPYSGALSQIMQDSYRCGNYYWAPREVSVSVCLRRVRGFHRHTVDVSVEVTTTLCHVGTAWRIQRLGGRFEWCYCCVIVVAVVVIFV